MIEREQMLRCFTPAFWGGVIGRVVILLLCAVVVGAVFQVARRGSFPWVGDWGHYIEAKARAANLTLVDRETVQQAVQTGSRWLIDARPTEEYAAGHIETALSMPADEPEKHAEVLSILTPADALVIYCSGYACDDSLVLAQTLREQGFTNLVLYAGGWAEWSGR